MVGWPRVNSYGFWNYNELHYTWEVGWTHKRYWINHEYGLAAGPWLMYLRSGERKYLRFAERHSRHIMDVDTIHYRPKMPQRVGGTHTWNVKRHWGSIPALSHMAAEYALYHYYVTGDVRGLDVAREHADFALSWVKSVGPYLRPTPRRPVRMNRTWHNTVRILIAVYEATWDPQYRDGLNEIVDAMLDNNLPRNVIHGSHYLSKAFAPYCELTQDARVKNVFALIADRYRRIPRLPGPSTYSYSLMAYAYDLTGGRRFLEHGADALRVMVNSVNRDPKDPYRRGEAGGWWSATFFFQQVPLLMGSMSRAGLTLNDLRMPRHVFHMRGPRQEFVMLEEKDREWGFALSKLGSHASKGVATVTLLDPKGRVVAQRKISRSTASNLYPFRIPQDGVKGVYRVAIDDAPQTGESVYSCSQWEIAWGPRKIMMRLFPANLIRTTGSHEFAWRYYFLVPEKTETFSASLAICVRGTYGARVFDPAGKVRGQAWWQGYSHVNGQRRIAIGKEAPVEPGVWSVGVKVYRGARLELEGVPTYVAARPDAVFLARETKVALVR